MSEAGLRDSGLGDSIDIETGRAPGLIDEVAFKEMLDADEPAVVSDEAVDLDVGDGEKKPEESSAAGHEEQNDLNDDAKAGATATEADEPAPPAENIAESTATAPKSFHIDVTCPKCDTKICSRSCDHAPPIPSMAIPVPIKVDELEDKSNEPEKPPTDRAYIEYKAVYVDPDDDDILFDTKSYKPTPLSAVEESQLSQPIFDVVKRYKASAHVPHWDRYDGSIKKPPRTDSKPQYSLVIRSKAIIRALQNVVQFYPGVDLFKDSIKIDEPFQVLVHHFDDLVAFRDARIPECLVDEACKTAQDTHEHLGMLIDFLERLTMPDVRAERARHQNGVATWDMLWLLLRPGTDVARLTFSGALTNRKSATYHRDGAVVQDALRNSLDSSHWEVKTWDLRFNGDVIGQEEHLELIPYFDGEMELSRISVLPIEFAPKAPNGMNAKEYLTSKGAKYFNLLQPQCKHHRGETLEYPFQEIEGQVQVDLPTFLNSYTAERPQLSEAPKGPQSLPAPDCDCFSCATPPAVENLLRKYATYNRIIPEIGSTLTPHQYFLCGQAVWAYMFKVRNWQLVDVGNLTDAEFRPEMINTLVIDPKRLKMLKALSQTFMRESLNTGTVLSQPWTADFIKGKGNSQIFLLHGPPGVGKTYTAECMAEHTRRPLMTLTSSDIGTTPTDVERNLQHDFKLAKKWQAILLIDEADIYLERRSLADLTRNSLVASFLRALEFYEGILFLTTNRVGSFDDAFVSRIHVKLHYPALSEDDREQIWENFINKLKAERGNAIRVMRDVQEYIVSPKIRALRLNGREIRNVFQTAVGLAEFEGDKDEEGKIKVSEDHLAQVAEMTGEFKNYLDDLHLADEEKRAEKSFLRKDETGSTPLPTPLQTPAQTPDRRR